MATYKLTQIATDYICIFLRISNTNYMQFVAAHQSIWYAVRRVPSGMARYVYRITSGEGPGDEAKWIQATLCCVVLDCSYLMRNTTHFCGGHFLHSNRSYEGSHVECVLTV